MNFRLKCEDPKDIVYTITLTASCEEFEKLREQLREAWPSAFLGRAITDLLSQARKIYWHTEEIDND